MSDNQRRIVSRIIFLLFCALPTAIAVYKICHPQTASGWAQAIQANLGVPTSIDSIETPGPYVTILHGLEFTDPEVGSIVKIVEAQILFDDTNTINIPFRVHGLTNRGLHRLARNLNNNLIRTYGSNKRWRVVFGEEMTIQEHVGAEKFEHDKSVPPPAIAIRDLQIDVVPEVDGTRASVWFQIAGQEQDNPIRATVSKTSNEGHWMQLDTKHALMPVWLVADAQPRIHQDLGDKSLFSGFVEYWPAVGRSQLLVDGRFQNVDLWKFQDLESDDQRFAAIELNGCRFENGVPVEWDARLQRPNYSYSAKIASDDLITYRKNVSLNQAIQITLDKETRIGHLPVNSPLR